MSPDEITAAATVAGVVVAGVFGLTGFIVGLVSLHHARQSKEAAASANLLAKDAAKVAKDANGIASESNTIATGANELSLKSNKIAKRSAESAEKAAKVVSEADARAVELHDVRWTGHWDRPGMYAVKNIGVHDATDVVVQIRFQGVIEVAEVPEVKSGEFVRLQLDKAKEVYDAAVARMGPYRSGNVSGFRAGPGSYVAHERIFWRTPLGAPREHSEDRNIPLKPKST